MMKLSEVSISRREFLKKGAIVATGLGIGYYALREFLPGWTEAPTPSESPELWKWSKEAYYYQSRDGYAQCKLCPNRCALREGERGICRTRINKGGKIYSLSYGNPCAVHLDPIEKKPLFHFLPGTLAFSIATAGCNLRCKFCQNWDIAQKKPEETQNYDLSPEKTVGFAIEQQGKYPATKTIAYTYSEPTAFYDYMLDTARIARKNNLRSVVITAGYINKEPLKELCKAVDAIKIDLKGFNNKFYGEVCGAELEPVLNSCRTVQKEGTWLEIVNLVVPTLNDDMDEIHSMCSWIVDSLGRDVPLHFSRFHPQYKLKNLPPTPQETLLEARNIAIEEGLNYVYVGNVPHSEYENTYCPSCKELVIERYGYVIKQNNLAAGRCRNCGEKIAGIWS